MRCLLLVPLIAGCDQVFGLDRGPSDSSTVDAPTPFNVEQCPVDYVVSAGAASSRYRIHESLFDYQAAKSYCFSAITHLWTFDTESPAVLADLVTTAGVESSSFHVGLEQPASAVSLGEMWHWITGELYKGVWGASEPNDGDFSEDSWEQVSAWSLQGGLLDQVGTEKRYFICECDGRTTQL